MKAEDRIQLKSGAFDRETWAALWDRLPERARRSTLEFVLQKLHALESSGQWRISWHYDTNEERDTSGAPIFAFDQPGDVITFKGSLKFGNVSEMTSDLELVSVACLRPDDWYVLREAVPASDLGDNYSEYTRREDQRFAELVRAGKNPCRVLVRAAEFLEWCSSSGRAPDGASRDVFANEKFAAELAKYRKRREDG